MKMANLRFKLSVPLAAMVKNELHKDPFTGTVFVFRARKTDRLKLLYWDGTELVMAYKRLEEHEFTWPVVKDGLMTLGHAQLRLCSPGLTGGGFGLWKRGLQKRWNDCGRITQGLSFCGSGGA